MIETPHAIRILLTLVAGDKSIDDYGYAALTEARSALSGVELGSAASVLSGERTARQCGQAEQAEMTAALERELFIAEEHQKADAGKLKRAAVIKRMREAGRWGPHTPECYEEYYRRFMCIKRVNMHQVWAKRRGA